LRETEEEDFIFAILAKRRSYLALPPFKDGINEAADQLY
jgi:hypothetical protein